MSDIFKQIQELQEKFDSIFEKGVTVDKWADAAQKRIDDNPQMGFTFRGKEELERLKQIADLPRDGKSANEVKKEAAKEEANAESKSAKAMLKGDKEEQDKQNEIAWRKGLIATDNKGYAFSKWKAPRNMVDNNSYNEIMTQILNLKEQFDNLFEVEGLGEPAVDVPPSQNKIKKDRKTKDGKVEVVSVEDELFPYEGNKREQYRQKILDTINAMIQGQATLEDLLQIVRQKKAPLKEAMEVLEEVSAKVRTNAMQKIVQKDYEDTAPLYKNYKEAVKKGDKEEASKSLKSIQDINKATDERLKKYNRYAEYRNSLKEAMKIMEELLLERNKENKIKKDEAVKKIGQEVIDDYEEEGTSLSPYGDDPKQWGRDKMSGYGDNLGVKRSIPKLADKLRFSGGAELDRKLGQKSYFDKEGRNKIINGFYLKALHKANKENSNESLKEAMEVIEQLLGESKPKDPKGYKENMDIANHYDNLYSKEPAKAPDGSPNSVAAEWNRRYQEYFDKAMKCYYGDKKKDSLKEALEETLKILELFDRPDLLNDIDTLVGSPVKNAIKRVFKGITAPKKEKKVKECKK